MKKSINILFSIWLGMIFQTSGLLAQPAGWNIVFTGTNHTLILPASSVFEVDGEPLPIGAWIGAFFELPDGSLQCGGRVEWRGASTVLAMYGTSGSTPPDGFANGEVLKLKLWLPEQDCIIDTVQVSYLTTPLYTHTGSFAINGLSGIGELQASSGVQLALAEDTALCVGASIELNAGCCGAIRWSTGAMTPSIIVSEAGVYVVEIESAIGCIKRDSVRVDSIGLPQADFQFNLNIDQVVCEASSQTGVTFQWDFGDGATGTGLNTNHTYTQTGLYTIQLIALNVCGADTSTQQVQVDIISSMDDAFAASLRVFPNPASHEVLLQTDSPFLIDASLLNTHTHGQIMKQLPFRQAAKLDISDMQTGMYLIIFHTSNGNFVTKHLLIKN